MTLAGLTSSASTFLPYTIAVAATKTAPTRGGDIDLTTAPPRLKTRFDATPIKDLEIRYIHTLTL